jgi:hypothetical protein
MKRIAVNGGAVGEGAKEMNADHKRKAKERLQLQNQKWYNCGRREADSDEEERYEV